MTKEGGMAILFHLVARFWYGLQWFWRAFYFDLISDILANFDSENKFVIVTDSKFTPFQIRQYFRSHAHGQTVHNIVHILANLTMNFYWNKVCISNEHNILSTLGDFPPPSSSYFWCSDLNNSVFAWKTWKQF